MYDGNLNGVIVIDKPQDISSAKVVASVKRALKAAKVGHAGTLDPFAEGVLVCCVNQATRLAGFLLHGPKKYAAVLKLGEETDTQDFTGQIVAATDPSGLSRKTIQNAFESFKGTVEQQPPVYSALKHKGTPLYKLARSGRPVQKPPRRVDIFEISVTRIDPPFVGFEVACSAGTYIRTLSADIGKYLGCGAHLHALKRIASSGFEIAQATPLSELEALACSGRLHGRMISMRDALPAMPECQADDDLVAKIRHGRSLTVQDLIDPQGVNGQTYTYVKIIDRKGSLIAIVERRPASHRLSYRCVFGQADN